MTTLALTGELWEELCAQLDSKVETAGFIIAGRARGGSRLTLLGRRIVWIPAEMYVRREATRLEIPSSGFVPPLGETASEDAVPIFFHTHPGGDPAPSALDQEVDHQLAPVAQLRTGQDLYASLILGGERGAERFSGRIVSGETATELERVRVIGDSIRVLTTDATAPGEVFDRQIRAFGTDGQQTLAALRVGVVGAGGTGSAAFEQLVRLGVGEITVIDDDSITESNLTRIHESGHADIGQPKVEVARRAAERIGLGTDVRVVDGRITSVEVVKALVHCDVVFGCTDDLRGRSILSRVAYWYIVPVFDTAFLVDTDGAMVRGLIGRVTTVMPGTPCLVCRGRIDPQALAAEGLPDTERERLAGEGYVPGLAQPDPSVGAFTTLTASFAVSELLHRLFGFAAEPASEVLIRLSDRALTTTSREPTPGHYCVDQGVLAAGDQDPLLGQLWVE